MNTNSDNDTPVRGLDGIDGEKGKPLPPVHLWHPENRRDIDMCIKADGSWHYMGSAIGRDRMVRLFSTVLRHDDDGFYLVTPVEMCRITVEDAPFVVTGIAIEGEGRGQTIKLTTSVGDDVFIGPDHPLRFAEADEKGLFVPYVLVRDRLEGRINRACYYDLMQAGDVLVQDDREWFGIWAGGVFWPIAPASELDA